ncbi:hypothetical protein, partial [Candidatus Frankia nodulisporulans]
MRIEASAGGVGVDMTCGLLLGPAMRGTVSSPGPVLVAASELDGDLVMRHAHRTHPRTQLILLCPQAHVAHGGVADSSLA